MSAARKQTVYIIAGPTASGKSARALALAAEKNGVIINADSMQIYDGLPILTAQPTSAEKEQVPHELYGTLHPNDTCSAGNWRELAEPVIQNVLERGQTPIVVGGSGLYIKALVEGLSPIPDIPEDIRAASVAKHEELGSAGFYEALEKRDPVMAARFHENHTARLIRAWEVLEATGKSLAEWQKKPLKSPPAHWDFKIEKIIPPREELRAKCDRRFLEMIEHGVLKEVASFGNQIESGEIKDTAPLKKALGFTHLWNYIKLKGGEIGDPDDAQPDPDLRDAIAKAQAETRQYAKRQTTWFRHQL